MQHKSQRQLQMGENLKRILAEIFLKNNYSSMNGNITTILEVSMSPDLKNARVFIDVFGNNATHIVEIVEKLNKLVPNIRHQIAKKLTARTIPELSFVLDETYKNANHIEQLLKQENPDLKPQNKL
jgi:ribosome-binding factor A